MPTPYELATNPSQYTGLSWIQEGRAGSTRTGFLLHYLEPFITACAGKTVLDIGTGVGWLPASAMDAGAIRAVGIEPSADHVAQGRKDHPNVEIEQTTLEGYDAQGQCFDSVFGILSFSHLADLDTAFTKVSSLLATGGEVVLVVPDYDYFRMPRDEELEVQELSDGDDSYAVTIKRSSGLLADVVRKVSVYERAARAVGLALRQQIAMKPTKQQIARVPKYGLLRDQALTRLLVFTANTETP